MLHQLLGRRPLFPGKDYVHQLNLITKVIGSPTEADMGFINSEKARRYIRSLPHSSPLEFSKLYSTSSPAAADLLSAMLVFNPSKRITVEQALEHPYLASLHDANDEPSAVAPFEFDFETDGLARRPAHPAGEEVE